MGVYKNGNPITGGSNEYQTLLEQLYPVGSIFLGVQAVCPLQALGIGTWELVGSNMALWGSNGSNAGTTISAGLPNITGYVGKDLNEWNRLPIPPTNCEGALYLTNNFGAHDIDGGWNGSNRGGGIAIDASRSNAIYGKSNTVQPPAYVINIWRRMS